MLTDKELALVTKIAEQAKSMDKARLAATITKLERMHEMICIEPPVHSAPGSSTTWQSQGIYTTPEGKAAVIAAAKAELASRK